MKLTHLSDESSQWCFNIIENKKLRLSFAIYYYLNIITLN